MSIKPVNSCTKCRHIVFEDVDSRLILIQIVSLLDRVSLLLTYFDHILFQNRFLISDGFREFISVVLFKYSLLFLIEESQLDFSVTQEDVPREEYNLITSSFSLDVYPNGEFPPLGISKVNLQFCFFGFYSLPKSKATSFESVIKVQKYVDTRSQRADIIQRLLFSSTIRFHT